MKIQTIPLHKGQAEIVNKFVLDDKIKYGVVCVGRQWGKSLMAMNVMIYWMMNNPKASGGWITPVAKHWMKAFNDIRDAVPDLIMSSNKQEGELLFINGSRLRFLSTENEDGLRGFTFTHAIVDECGFVKESAYSVLNPTWGVLGRKVLFISTPGLKNWFYRKFVDGENPEVTDTISFKATSYDNPYFSDSDIEAERRVMPEEQFRQEYLAEFSEIAGGVFNGLDGVMRVDEFLGNYSEPCYLGVDIALGGKDKTCVVIMDGAGKIINIERWQEKITDRQISRIKMICEHYNIHRGFIEMNQERGIQQAISRFYPQIRPWETTRKTKPKMIQNLKKDIEEGLLAVPTRTLDPVFFNEFSNFTFEKKEDGYIKYGHPEGFHDDTVIATALANEARVPHRHTQRDWMTEFNKWNR